MPARWRVSGSSHRSSSPRPYRSWVVGSFRPARAAEVRATLTSREHEILLLISRGHTIQQIASRLAISPKTVETHVAKLYRKLDVRTRVQAVARAHALGLIELGRTSGRS